MNRKFNLNAVNVGKLSAAIAKSARGLLLSVDEIAELSAALCRTPAIKLSPALHSQLALLDLSATYRNNYLTLRDGAGRTLLCVINKGPPPGPARAESRTAPERTARTGAVV